ncbi:Maf family protein [Fluviibacter phosphoraccumulans]|jgi:septum formation protein|uniref:dTTP/UTP pyrophosphatase n=1 Tax=Fluviibacter phosphoraccumulans TaxID=1751046 RepID=A0A679I977_9RHOO|nr:Maf family protein [Fluviibacter phosphoraccumulans]BBU68431.1 Maf-like protein [Fluviibacter phosphoraccumulans]BBU72414.1 Maf-like protein [Fluviibacter phosphoraccumulans]BCA66614.1 Maf-like protein [Fluviibacter phosphoraccumulans]
MQTIWLASKSPRRAELLQGMGVPFEVLQFTDAAGAQYEVDESVHPGEPPRDYVRRVALDKALHALSYMRDRQLVARPLLSADTTVALGDRILGKPADAAEAREMLGALSGQVHEVLTAVVVIDGHDIRQMLSVSRVHFMPLSVETIDRYIASGEPFDKAGAYGIQGHAGTFVADMQGSFTGIMGLPVHETACLLEHCGYRF